MSRNDPYRKFRFRIEIDGIAQAGFTECMFGNSSTEVIEYREGTDPARVRKLSGLTRHGNITLKWGITDSMALYTWFKSTQQMGTMNNRRNLSIVLINEDGQDKCRWNCIETWPVRYDAPDFNAKANEVAIETLEIVCEECTRVQ
jgi:phage tail-like protein